MTSEVKADLKIELSDLNSLCSHASLASKGFLGMIHTTDGWTGQLSSIDERCTLVKIVRESCTKFSVKLKI